MNEKCSRCKNELDKCDCNTSHTSEINGLAHKTAKTPDYDKVMDKNNHNYKFINKELLNED